MQEASGPTLTRAEGTRVEAVNNQLTLPYGRLLPSTQVGTTGFYMGQFSGAHPVLGHTTTEGTIVIARDDKQFLILESGGAFAELYDPATQKFTDQTTTGDKPTAAIAAGALAIKRPDGKYLVAVGGATRLIYMTECTIWLALYARASRISCHRAGSFCDPQRRWHLYDCPW